MRRLLPLLGWLIAVPAVGAATIEFEARLWAPDLSGAAVVNGAGPATTIDLASDLGLGQEELLDGRLIFRPSRRTSVRLSYTRLDFSGNALLDRRVTFGGATFQLDAQIASRLDLDYAGLGFAWQFLSTADGRVRFGPLVEARGLRGEAEIRTDLAGLLPLSAREKVELGFAAAGLALDVEPTGKLHLWAEWTSAVEADEGDLTDLAAGVRYRPLDVLVLTAGYRRLQIDFADRGDVFDFELDGPFFGAALTF